MRDPLWLFAALGLAIFGVDAAMHADTEAPDEIVVSADFVAALADDFEARNGRIPSEEEVAGMVELFVEDEMLHRQALALGLDRGDLIVRRRLIQKMRFLTEDRAPITPVTDEEVAGQLATNAGRYEIAARFDVEHVFFRDGLAAARIGRSTLLDGVDRRRVGDSFFRGHVLRDRTSAELSTLLGTSPAAVIADLEVGEWSEAVPSRHGAHVLRVVARTEARAATLGDVEVAAKARRAIVRERRDTANAQWMAELRAEYDVRLDREDG